VRRRRATTWLAGLLALCFAAAAFGRDPLEQREIDYLIESIAALPQAHFVRNGAEFDARQAADHLRMKLRRAGERVATADDFIVYCASGSSVTGQKYLIRFADGRRIEAARFLREQLTAYRAREGHGG